VAPREIRDVYLPPSLLPKLFGKKIQHDEVRQIIANAPNIRRGPKNTDPQQEGRCYFVVGKTDAGRTLKVLLRRFDNGWSVVITAWEP
jgi:hypothetical protein